MPDLAGVLACVVIPAHNEGAVIERCLRTLQIGAQPGQLEIIVVCNGCVDDTAAVARRVAAELGADVTVLETSQASKIVALRLGDAHSRTFPRIYLDADIELTGAAAIAVARRLDGTTPPAGRPPLRYDTVGASFLVRRYYAARSRVPTLMSALWGAGVYAMSGSGRGRFDEWPDVMGDDLFVDLLFSPAEIEIIDAEPAVVRTPRTVESLLKILRRAHRGKTGMPQRRPTGPGDSLGGTLRGLARSSLGSPARAFDAAVFAGFAVAARIGSATATSTHWERDLSTRPAR